MFYVFYFIAAGLRLCASVNQTIVTSHDGLSPVRRQTNVLINTGLSLIGPGIWGGKDIILS